jgi:steroid 5-alpha reductase family enzyme
MAVLVTIWGIRLTINFGRRGGYGWPIWRGEEDYRWGVLRAKPEFKNKFIWALFNFFFISLYQMVLILLFILPIIRSTGGWEFSTVDILLGVIFLVFIVLETIADQQQWNFQTEKYRRIHNGEELGPFKDGFVSSGLWRYVRHPNYASEQAIWIVFYLFSVSATGIWINWSIMGCLLLIILFNNSSKFSEELSSKKYPKYQEYQREVSRFIPRIL